MTSAVVEDTSRLAEHNDRSSIFSGDENMIALYYCYPPSNIIDPSKHASFHQDLCTSLKLGGRIRVSYEGINGVLSGKVADLKEYESKLRHELVKEATASNSNDRGNAGVDAEDALKQTHEYLDIKYCHLRPDILIEEQLFDTLHVKVTKEVVSLFDFSALALNQGKKNKRCRQRRRQKRKEKKQFESETEGAIDESKGNDVVTDVAAATEILDINDSVDGKNPDQTAKTSPNIDIGSAFTIHDWEQYTPAEHLSPEEWNDRLLSLSQKASKPQQQAEHQNKLPGDAILLDARNIYETRVGHFAVPNLPTFFPNTRKFSSLPMALNTPEAAEALAGKKVFMYCTGGIRCERAGSYLRALTESNAGAWKDKEAPKGIYQLKGGIQRYLETYGEYNENDVTGNTQYEDIGKPACLYRGKNFVFDPRRTDPVVGNGIVKTPDSAQVDQCANNNDRVSLVGKCILCCTPHDDYDNGHSPCAGKEARCCRCRVLVLVCNACRADVRCWGESEGKNELYCGQAGKACVDEGNIAENVETEMF